MKQLILAILIFAFYGSALASGTLTATFTNTFTSTNTFTPTNTPTVTNTPIPVNANGPSKNGLIPINPIGGQLANGQLQVAQFDQFGNMYVNTNQNPPATATNTFTSTSTPTPNTTVQSQTPTFTPTGTIPTSTPTPTNTATNTPTNTPGPAINTASAVIPNPTPVLLIAAPANSQYAKIGPLTLFNSGSTSTSITFSCASTPVWQGYLPAVAATGLGTLEVPLIIGQRGQAVSVTIGTSTSSVVVTAPYNLYY